MARRFAEKGGQWRSQPITDRRRTHYTVRPIDHNPALANKPTISSRILPALATAKTTEWLLVISSITVTASCSLSIGSCRSQHSPVYGEVSWLVSKLSDDQRIRARAILLAISPRAAALYCSWQRKMIILDLTVWSYTGQNYRRSCFWM